MVAEDKLDSLASTGVIKNFMLISFFLVMFLIFGLVSGIFVMRVQ